VRLVLSSAAAPEATATELAEACLRRGLSGIEFVLPSIKVDDGNIAAFRAELVAAGVELSGIFRPTMQRAEVTAAAEVAAAVGTPIIVPGAAIERSLLPEAAEAFARAGAHLLLSQPSDPEAVVTLRQVVSESLAGSPLGLAWEIRPGSDDPLQMERVLEMGGDLLRYIRLHGGGPEAHAQSGMGIGSIMGRLTLARFGGPLVLLPSNARYHYVWRAWLGRAGGWGCGSKQGDETLVALPSTSNTTRGVG